MPRLPSPSTFNGELTRCFGGGDIKISVANYRKTAQLRQIWGFGQQQSQKLVETILASSLLNLNVWNATESQELFQKIEIVNTLDENERRSFYADSPQAGSIGGGHLTSNPSSRAYSIPSYPYVLAAGTPCSMSMRCNVMPMSPDDWKA